VFVYNSNLIPTQVKGTNGIATLATTTLNYDARGRLDTVDGPLSGTADTTKYRYDNADQLVGVTSPDPDGAGTGNPNRAIRLTYRQDGQVSKQELGTVASQSDADWANFAVKQWTDIGFDTNNRPVTSQLSGKDTLGNTAAYALTQTSYDALGWVDCSAVRMNIAVYGSLPASACTLSTQGSDGPDRISQLVYDAVGRVTQLKVGVATTDAATERTLTYTTNGLVQTLKDAENNLTTHEYDGFDRLAKTRFPLPTKGANASSTSDYEQLLNYDANSNVGQRRLRDGSVINFSYDNLDRVTLKDLPGSEPDVSYVYDNLSRLISASQSGNALSFTYDALSRNIDQTRTAGSFVTTATSSWDAAGRRTQLTYPGTGLYLNYDHLVTGEVTKIRENGATSGVGVLASYAYDALGNRTSVMFGNGVVQNFTYDPVQRLASLSNDLSGTANDLSVTFAYNPASQLKQAVRSGDAYAFTLTSENSTGIANGLNQLTSYAGKSLTYTDGRGNVTAFGTDAYGYLSENLLTSGPSSTSLSYDPAMRLYQMSSGSRGGGATSNNGGTLNGGPCNGVSLSAGSCNWIPGSDPGAQQSIDYWQGYYMDDNWVSTNPSIVDLGAAIIESGGFARGMSAEMAENSIRVKLPPVAIPLPRPGSSSDTPYVILLNPPPQSGPSLREWLIYGGTCGGGILATIGTTATAETGVGALAAVGTGLATAAVCAAGP
jgi:YD repeat-containing protein